VVGSIIKVLISRRRTIFVSTLRTRRSFDDVKSDYISSWISVEVIYDRTTASFQASIF
jgi:hypothetical protein